jgi:hypothetical protein
MRTAVLLGSLGGIPANIIVDDSNSLSSISLAFANTHNLPRTVSVIDSVAFSSSSAPLMVPANGGWFQSVFAVEIVSETLYDVLLGRDWILACHPSYDGNSLSPELLDGVVSVESGHHWVPYPIGMSFCMYESRLSFKRFLFIAVPVVTGDENTADTVGCSDVGFDPAPRLFLIMMLMIVRCHRDLVNVLPIFTILEKCSARLPPRSLYSLVILVYWRIH